MNTQKPNFLFIICDDLGWGDLSCHGNKICKTPCLDQLALQGVSARRHLSGPLCSPARASVFTGRYHYRSRIVDTYCGRSIMDPDETTLAEVLSENGYATGLFGKWHLGDTPTFRPEDRGFHKTLWHLGGGIGQPGDYVENHGRDSYFNPVLCANGKALKSEGYCTDIFTDATIDFIEQNKKQPWFAYVGFNAPHTPLQVDADKVNEIAARGASGDLAAFYAMVENIDSNVGKLLGALEQTGQAQNTIVVFTSDHGRCPSVRDAKGDIRFNGGLRGYKGTPYEGGIRVPCFWRWPEGLPAGKLTNKPTHAIDIFPTFLAAADIPLPGDRAIDGMDVLPVLRGDAAFESDRILFLQWHRGDKPVCGRNCMATTETYKWVSVCEGDAGELYDIATDPSETEDVSLLHPNIHKMLSNAYSSWYSEVSSPHNFKPVHLPVIEHLLPITLTRQDWRVRGADGWSSKTKGFWPLTMSKPIKVCFEVHFDVPPDSAGTVYLHCAGSVFSQRAIPQQSAYSFDVLLPAGEHAVESGWISTFEQASPLYINIS